MKPSLLVADDYPYIAHALAELLRVEFGDRFRIDVAHDGIQAAAFAIAQCPVAALLDIKMPRLDGIGAARAIRSAYPLDWPLLIGTSASPLALGKANDAAVFDQLLLKPTNITESIVFIAQIIRDGAAAQNNRGVQPQS